MFLLTNVCLLKACSSATHLERSQTKSAAARAAGAFLYWTSHVVSGCSKQSTASEPIGLLVDEESRQRKVTRLRATRWRQRAGGGALAGNGIEVGWQADRQQSTLEPAGCACVMRSSANCCKNVVVFACVRRHTVAQNSYSGGGG